MCLASRVETPEQPRFGPDICGDEVSLIQLVFNWKGRNLHRSPEIGMDFEDRDARSHTYTLVLKPDNSYKVYVDLKEKSSGSLHDFWDYPKITMDDPSDEKPSDWVEQRRMVDPDSKKPKDGQQRVTEMGQASERTGWRSSSFQMLL